MNQRLSLSSVMMSQGQAWVSEPVKLLSHVRLFATSWTVAYQVPPSMGFSRQEYWSGLSFPSPGDLPNPGTEPRSPALQADPLPSEPPGVSGQIKAKTRKTSQHEEEGWGGTRSRCRNGNWLPPETHNREEDMLSLGTGLNDTGDKVSHPQGQAGPRVRRAWCRKA